MSLQQHEQPLARVADVLRNDDPAGLLIGAGCSVSAGIPSGDGFAQIIRNRYSSVESDGYAKCMSQLPKPQQKSLIQEKINEADINWAHVAIGQLIDHGLVDRILTTNFDPLVSRACALIGRFPAVYDYAAAPGTFNAGAVSDPSVFHLHGQGTGFVLKNSQSEMRELTEALPDLLEDTLRNRPLVVVGYGAGDPVFDALVSHGQFHHELYWITYEQSDPPDHVQRRLLEGCPSTYFVRSSDADSFFIRLTRELECFPPTFVEKPFSHQLELLDSLTEFPSLGEETVEGDEGGGDGGPSLLERDSGDDIMQNAERMIKEAVARFEEGIHAKVNRAWSFFGAGKYEEIEEMWESCESEEEREALRQPYAASMHQEAQTEHVRIRESSDSSSLDDLREIAETYQQVLEVDPSYTQVLRSLGNLYVDMVRADADDPEGLFNQAIDRYRAAVDVNETDHRVLNNWGYVLRQKVGFASGEEARNLLDEAIDKYRQALDIKSDMHSSLNNWGGALTKKAELASGEEARNLLDEAIDKYRHALDIKPDKDISLHNWGYALRKKAELGSDEDAIDLLNEAIEKFRRALDTKPDDDSTLHNCGDALREKAELASDEDAIDLLDEAIDKYRHALDINPDKHASLHNWGDALVEKAQHTSGEGALDSLDEAIDKYKRALDIKPDKDVSLHNWGYALHKKAQHTSGDEALNLLDEAIDKYRQALDIKPDDHASLKNLGYALRSKADQIDDADEAERLRDQAEQKLEEAK